jgi:hypothetical protein
LSDAYELDDAPHLERFVLITSDEPLQIEAIERALEALPSADSPLILSPSVELFEHVIIKEP